MNIQEAEQDEELSEWVVIQTSQKSQNDSSTPQHLPILQPSHNNDDDDDDCVVSIVEEEEEEVGESSSCLNLLRVIKDSGHFFNVCCNYLTRSRVFWSFSIIGGFLLVSSLVYVKLLRWWKRLQEEKMRSLICIVREKDQKIKELIVEIGRMNEMLSSRRRVRVVRIM
ncbi:unnamed protein product [Cochlearia groenlandica]